VTEAQTTNKSLLLVHGRDFKPRADVLLELSLAALRSGLERDYPDCVATFDAMHTDLAWYGDLNAEILQAKGKSYDEELDIADRRNALQALREITPRKKFGVRLYDTLPGKSALPEFCASICAPLLGLFGARKPFIGWMAKDFAAYSEKDSNFASIVRTRVREKLCALLQRGDEVMLVSHGTGSVIAYDVLWELSNDVELAERYGKSKVDHWITLGSPLGDRAVRRHLLGAKQKGEARFPGNVIAWHNLSAEDDYSSLDNTLADDFRKMLQLRRVSFVKDYHVFNLAVRYGRTNPHSSVGYLIHPRMAKIIADWIT
jgi:hypothetical protein